jgi:hypothetical protein
MKTIVPRPPLPNPSPDEQHAIKEAREKKSKRRPAARFGLRQDGKAGGSLASSHSDQEGWRDRIRNAFGTRSDDFVDVELRRVLTMFRDKDGEIDATAVEAVLAVLDGSEPQNETEAMLLIQIATTHALTMKIARRLTTVDTIPQNDSASVTLARLQRTFTTQIETLASLRRGGRQKMTVEHVHVHSGGQAIVGTVNTRGGQEQIENERQPHALPGQTPTIGPGAAMRSADPEREALPIPAGAAQEAMPNARRRSRIRSTERRA